MTQEDDSGGCVEIAIAILLVAFILFIANCAADHIRSLEGRIKVLEETR